MIARAGCNGKIQMRDCYDYKYGTFRSSAGGRPSRLVCYDFLLCLGGLMDSSRNDRLFQKGLDAFNSAHFYDAHEHWEEVWLETPNPEKLFLQGLIQVAAAFHHYSRDNSAGHAKPSAGRSAEARYLSRRTSGACPGTASRYGPGVACRAKRWRKTGTWQNPAD